MRDAYMRCNGVTMTFGGMWNKQMYFIDFNPFPLRVRNNCYKILYDNNNKIIEAALNGIWKKGLIKQ